MRKADKRAAQTNGSYRRASPLGRKTLKIRRLSIWKAETGPHAGHMTAIKMPRRGQAKRRLNKSLAAHGRTSFMSAEDKYLGHAANGVTISAAVGVVSRKKLIHKAFNKATKISPKRHYAKVSGPRADKQQ